VGCGREIEVREREKRKRKREKSKLRNHYYERGWKRGQKKKIKLLLPPDNFISFSFFFLLSETIMDF